MHFPLLLENCYQFFLFFFPSTFPFGEQELPVEGVALGINLPFANYGNDLGNFRYFVRLETDTCF